PAGSGGSRPEQSGSGALREKLEHGRGARAHPAPDLEGFGGLFDQHSPALHGAPTPALARPRDKWRVCLRVSHVVADGRGANGGARNRRYLSAQACRRSVEDEVERIGWQLVEAASAYGHPLRSKFSRQRPRAL